MCIFFLLMPIWILFMLLLLFKDKVENSKDAEWYNKISNCVMNKTKLIIKIEYLSINEYISSKIESFYVRKYNDLFKKYFYDVNNGNISIEKFQQCKNIIGEFYKFLNCN